MSRDEAALKLVDLIQVFGLHAVEPPPPLEPITDEDVGVVCWMAVLPAMDRQASGASTHR
jgi:hypothetical protein